MSVSPDFLYALGKDLFCSHCEARNSLGADAGGGVGSAGAGGTTEKSTGPSHSSVCCSPIWSYVSLSTFISAVP